MKKKIVFAVRALWMGGIEISLVNLLNSLDYAKFDVTCILTSRELTLAERIDSRCRLIVFDRDDAAYRYRKIYGLGQECENPSILHKMILWAKPLFYWLDNRLFIQYIKARLRKEYFDVCVIYDVSAAETAVKAVKAGRYIMFYHHGAMGRTYHDAAGYEKSSDIVVVSKILCERMKHKYPKYAHKMRMIHNVIDVCGILEKSNEFIPGYDNRTFNIVSCGRLSYEKGMDRIAAVCRRLTEKGLKNFKWYIIGGGREEKKLKDLIYRCDLEGNIELLGEKQNPYPYIKAADLFVQLSRTEAYGLSLLEALLLRIPAIATRTDGAEEVLENGKYGMLCDYSPEEIAERIYEIMNNPSLYNKLKNKALGKDIKDDNQENIRLLMNIFGGEE